MSQLLSVSDALARILALADPLPIEQAPLVAAAGRTLAADVVALRTQPAADLSAMDGYALRFEELGDVLRVVGESAAGGGLDRALVAGEAARIFTGAPVPDGADTVLVQEEAARDGDTLRLAGEGPPHMGAHIRRAGSDFAAGAVLLAAGAAITPAAVGLAAIGGHGALPVRRRARVALISTGDELVRPGEPAAGAQLPASNAPMLAALLARWPVDTIDLGIVRDDMVALVAAFRAVDADILVTTGGASVGDHDLVRPALEAAGATLDFWRIAMKPGKPLMAGTRGGMMILGLPGNPVSAFVTASLFLQPLIAKLTGSDAALPVPARLRLGGMLPGTGARAEYLRGRQDGSTVVPVGQQDSAALRALALADCLIVRPPHAAPAAIGDMVEVLSLA